MTTNKVTYSTFMIGIECMFDLRLAALFLLGEEHVLNAIKSGYYERKSDLFPGVDPTKFKALLQSGNKRLLSNCTVTELVNMAREFVEITFKRRADTPFSEMPKIVLNVYPFVLSDSEKEPLIHAVRSYIAGSIAEVEIVSMSVEEITPKYLDDNISIIAMYYFTDWLEAHSVNGNLKTKGCPAVSMLSPDVYFTAIPTAKQLQEIKKSGKDSPKQVVEEVSGMFIKLILLPAPMFSSGLRLDQV